MTMSSVSVGSSSRPGLFWFSSPQTFFPLAGKMTPWFFALAAVLAVFGLYIGFFVAPTDATQGESYRIIFIHVPAAWMSMFLYLVMAFWAAIGLIMNTRVSSMMASAIAPTGALMTVLALVTGSLWGRPTWGTYWVWDARLTSELVLLFLVSRISSITGRDRRSSPCRQGGRGAGAGRRYQHSNHLFFGAVVEHAAPGLVGQPDALAFDGRDDAAGHAVDGAGLLDV